MTVYMSNPTFDSTLNKDADTLHQYIKEAEKQLATLPATFKCNVQEKKLKDAMIHTCRTVRSQFISRHRETIYAALTNDYNEYHRLTELVYLASEQFPGLVPTREQIDQEKTQIQAHKEGFEIDQGIFFNGLLQSKRIGNHLLDAMLLPCQRALHLLPTLQNTTHLDLGTVLYERQTHTAFLTINNPQSLNAENNRFVNDMETAVDLALMDEQVTTCVLRGGVMTHPRYKDKRVFCAGINLKELINGHISFVEFLLTRELGFISKIVHGTLHDPLNPILSLRSTQKPWIAVVDSFAIGGGMQIVLACDKVIAADNSYFSLPAAQEGIIPGAANYRLSHLCNNRLTRQIILFGKKIWASSTESRYFCDDVVPNVELDTAIEVAIHALNQPAVIANRRMLNLAGETRTNFIEYMAEFAYVQAIRLYSEDVLNKINRFTKEASSC